MNSQSAIYGLKCESRCVTSVDGQRERHHFLVGTCSAKEENELHVIEFDEDRNEVNSVSVFSHPDEVWQLASHPTLPALFTSVHYHGSADRATLWRIPEAATDDSSTSASTADTGELSEVLTLPLPDTATSIRAVVFNPMEGGGDAQLLSLDNEGMKLFTLSSSSSSLSPPVSTYTLAMPDMYSACWDPHHPALLVASSGSSITGRDVRLAPSAPPTHLLPHAHSDSILSLDYNPNKPYHIISGGRDRLLHIHDIRKPASPLVTLQQHTHWVWSVRYNRFHDQLILSCGSEDVALWSVVSVSSAPLGELEVSGGGDKLIATYSDHEDSIYSGCWSAFDAWVFATCSYDGRVVVNLVPPAEKYKILL